MQAMYHLVEHYGLLVVFLAVLVESLGLPLPSLVVLIIAGAFAATGQLSLLASFALAVVADVAGEIVWYAAGRRYGARVLRALCQISLSPDSCVRSTEDYFDRWGAKTLVVSKFIPGLSTIAPPLAGAMRTGVMAFLGYSVLGSVLYAGAGLGLGIAFHGQIDYLGAIIARFGTIALYALGGLFALYILVKWWERQRFMHSLRMARISVHELERLLRAGAGPVVLDVRSAAARQVDGRKIPGARLYDGELAIDALAGTEPDSDVVVYCSCPNEASAARVARLLQDRGFRRVRPLAGGLEAWIAAGLAVELVVEAEAQGQTQAPVQA